jgi:hypothetical protein
MTLQCAVILFVRRISGLTILTEYGIEYDVLSWEELNPLRWVCGCVYLLYHTYDHISSTGCS